MRHLTRRAPLALAALLALGAAARADKASDADKAFLARAAADGDAEVKFAQLAEKQAGAEAVKNFARDMIKDHEAANKQLANLATDLKVGVVAGLEKDVRDAYDALSKLKGADFDRAYMHWAVETHEKAVKFFEDESKLSGLNGNLKKFADDTLPRLREHLKKAREVNEMLKTSK